jgi:hypothetical protein
MSRAIAISLAGTAASTIGSSTLQLWQPNPPGYIVEEGGWTPGQSTLRRSTTDSQFIRGRQLVDAVEDVRSGVMVVHCLGSTGANLKTLVEHLRIALRQWTYTMAWNFDGFTENWQCEPADLNFGPSGAVDEFNLAYFSQQVVANIPYSTTDGAL